VDLIRIMPVEVAAQGPWARRLRWIRLAASLLLLPSVSPAQPIVIAHRGASGYLPEHTLEAAAFAYALGADYLEQDVVMSRDGVLVVSHDIHVDTTTDVAARFPERRRADGRYYAIDFTWAELRTLNVRERFDEQTGEPVFPRRFPATGASFRLATMEEAILLVQGLNRSTGRNVGVYPEIKAPAWHAGEGRDPGRALLALLARHGYQAATDNAYVQCFEAAELRRLRDELRTELRLVLLIEAGTQGDPALLTPAGLREIAAYAQGIGPHLSHIVEAGDAGGTPRVTSLVEDAHAAGLVVHPYTFRADALPRAIGSMDALLELFIHQAKVDGMFIDQPDFAVRFLRR
jgi:glycerophosphoryl diester phosphodiesterase